MIELEKKTGDVLHEELADIFELMQSNDTVDVERGENKLDAFHKTAWVSVSSLKAWLKGFQLQEKSKMRGGYANSNFAYFVKCLEEALEK